MDESTWMEVGTKASLALTAADDDVARVHPSVAALAALWRFRADVLNGGFVQFFCNRGYHGYLAALDVLDRIGATATATLARRCYAAIAPLEDEPELTDLWDIPRLLDDARRMQIAELDAKLWDAPDDLPTLWSTHDAG